MDINDEYLRFKHVLKQPLKNYNISQPGSWEELTQDRALRHPELKVTGLINEVELTGPTKPSSEVLLKGLSLMGSPDDVTGIVCNKTQHC